MAERNEKFNKNRHGDLDLHLVHPVDHGHGHRGGDVGVLLGAQADQGAGDGGHNVARAVS